MYNFPNFFSKNNQSCATLKWKHYCTHSCPISLNSVDFYNNYVPPLDESTVYNFPNFFQQKSFNCATLKWKHYCTHSCPISLDSANFYNNYVSPVYESIVYNFPSFFSLMFLPYYFRYIIKLSMQCVDFLLWYFCFISTFPNLSMQSVDLIHWYRNTLLKNFFNTFLFFSLFCS